VGGPWYKDCGDRFSADLQGHHGNTFGAKCREYGSIQSQLVRHFLRTELSTDIEVFFFSVTEKLPFPDSSFDYVRLNDAVVVIPRGRWDFVLSEAHRVLRPGGRLELIHDQLCFPFVGPETPVSCTFAPSKREPSRNVFYVREPETGKGAAANVSPPRYGKSPFDNWEAEIQNCRRLEELYLEMLAQRYGVHPQPRGTLMDAIRRRFGSSASHIKVSNAHICLPSRDFMARSDAETAMRNTRPKKREFGISITIDWGHDKADKTKNLKTFAPPAPREFPSLTGLPPVLSKKAASLMGVVQLSPAGAPYQPPGLVVVRTSSEGARRSMTFLPMSPSEIDAHSNKHIHSLLSAKLALEAYIEELQVNGKPTMSREDLDEALWQYALSVSLFPYLSIL
jgi:SAM-dependent methyltransferase